MPGPYGLPTLGVNAPRFRNTIFRLAPTWLRGPWGERFLGLAGLFLDAITEWERQGTRARLPMDDGHPDGQLEQIGADRVIVRGWSETDASYAQRLRQALLTWQRAGSAEAIMRACAAWVLPSAVPTVGVPQGTGGRRVWYELPSYEAACSAELVDVFTSQWNWDNDASAWARIWVVVHVDNTILPRKYVGAWTIGPATSVGANVQPAWFAGIGQVARQWKAAHSIVTLLFSYDPAWPSKTGTGSDYPDGTWGQPYLFATLASPRYAGALYMAPLA